MTDTSDPFGLRKMAEQRMAPTRQAIDDATQTAEKSTEGLDPSFTNAHGPVARDLIEETEDYMTKAFRRPQAFDPAEVDVADEDLGRSGVTLEFEDWNRRSFLIEYVLARAQSGAWDFQSTISAGSAAWDIIERMTKDDRR